MSKMKVEVHGVEGIRPALIGMRHPYNSWSKSDTIVDENGVVRIGDADLTLAKKLIGAGQEHSKFLRQIQVWLNITMPRYWWVEFDTYKFNTKNSTSTMHTLLGSEPILRDDFVYSPEDEVVIDFIIDKLNKTRECYQIAKSENEFDIMLECLKSAKRILPEGFLQTRMVNTSYAELMNVVSQRRYHALKEEWGLFNATVFTLPYMIEFFEARRK